MTPDAQRIAIAEACPEVFRVLDGKVYWKNDSGLCDQLNDLNAMHEAVSTLSREMKVSWADYLYEVARRNHHEKDVALATATAAQRAEAFLRALGKWTD